MASKYETEYFHDFDAYKIEQMKKKETVSMSSWGGYNFDFYEIDFSNGCKSFLFSDYGTCEKFINYCKLDSKAIKYVGKLEDINHRVITESINRGEDFIEECKRLAEGKDYIIFIAPFELSYEKDPASELRELLKNVRK